MPPSPDAFAPSAQNLAAESNLIQLMARQEEILRLARDGTQPSRQQPTQHLDPANGQTAMAPPMPAPGVPQGPPSFIDTSVSSSSSHTLDTAWLHRRPDDEVYRSAAVDVSPTNQSNYGQPIPGLDPPTMRPVLPLSPGAMPPGHSDGTLPRSPSRPTAMMTPDELMDRIRARTDRTVTTDTPKIQKRTAALDKSIRWQKQDFAIVKRALDGHIISAGMGYIIDTSFLKAYHHDQN